MLLTGLLAVGAMAQNKTEGIQFKEDTFANLLKASEDAGKPIFIDVYTTWCGPCKFLSSNIFPDKAVGEYMNATFVNAKFDAEQGEGQTIASRYKVTAYPTMLILNSKGEEISRVIGMSRTPEDFIQRVQETMAKAKK